MSTQDRFGFMLELNEQKYVVPSLHEIKAQSEQQTAEELKQQVSVQNNLGDPYYKSPI
jgi:hypothetical protein